MELISFFGLNVLIYAAVAVCLVKALWKNTSRKLYPGLVAAFVILLPTWDVLLSSIIYYSACPFVPKSVVYETAETDGIYYEGKYRNDIWLTFPLALEPNPKIKIHSNYDDLHNGYQYFEVLAKTVREDNEKKDVSPPRVYRCAPQGEYPQNPRYRLIKCSPAESIQSNYLVKHEVHKFLLVSVNSVKIYNRSTATTMAEYRDFVLEGYRGWVWGPIPFFNWLGLESNMVSHGGSHSPEKLRYFDFQYDVLKVKKK